MRRAFHVNEDEAIKQGVRVFGEGNWAKIKANFPELENRSGVQIKDRFRNMMKKEKEVSAKIASGNPVTPGSSAKKGSAEKKKVPKLELMEYVPDVPVASPAEIKSPGKSECPTLDDCAPKMLVADVPQVPPSPQTSKTVVYFEITIKNLSCTLYEIGLVQKTFPALYELCHHAKEGVRKLMNIISTYDSAEEWSGAHILEIFKDANITFENFEGLRENISSCIEAFSSSLVNEGKSLDDTLPFMKELSRIILKVYDGKTLEECMGKCKERNLSASVVKSQTGVVRPGKPDIALIYHGVEMEMPKPKPKKVKKQQEKTTTQTTTEATAMSTATTTTTMIETKSKTKIKTKSAASKQDKATFKQLFGKGKGKGKGKAIKAAAAPSATAAPSQSTPPAKKKKGIAVDLVSSPSKSPGKRSVSFAAELAKSGPIQIKKKAKKNRKGKKEEEGGKKESASAAAPTPATKVSPDLGGIVVILTQKLASGEISGSEYKTAIEALNLN